MTGVFGQDFLEQQAIFEVHRHMDIPRQIRRIQIELFEERREKFRRLEVLEVFPIEIPAIHHAAPSQVEQVYSHLGRFGIPRKHVGIVARSSGDLLALFHLRKRTEEIAVACGFLVALLFRSALHALFEAVRKIAAPPFEEEPHVARGFRVAFIGDEFIHARAQAAVDVILQAGTRVRAREINGARRHKKVLVDQMHKPVRETGRKVEGRNKSSHPF